MIWTWVLIGAAVGAVLRYAADRAVQGRHDTVFPWGTLTANVSACLVLGLVTGAVSTGAASPDVRLVVDMGFCGALSTFSTFSYGTLQLARKKQWFFYSANVIVSVIAGVGAMFMGAAFASAMWGS